MSEQLRFIASYDDVINFCDTDESLAKRFREIFEDGKDRSVTFNPVLSAASNPSVFEKHDIWTKPKSSTPCTRKFGAFDANKYTRLFIKRAKEHMKDASGTEPLKRDGFDPYAYLMAYEEEIMLMYTSSDLSRLDKAALHFVEIGKPIAELDTMRYVASHNDLIKEISKTPSVTEEVIVSRGNDHYNTTGFNEIMNGTRQSDTFFSATKYIASHAHVAENFVDENGDVDSTKAALAYITWGAANGATADGFLPFVYLANNLDLIEEDIYTNGEVSVLKVAKIWINRFKDGIKLDNFDPLDFKETMELGEDDDPWKEFVLSKIAAYRKQLANEKRCLYRLGKWLCSSRPKADEEKPPAAEEEKPPAAEEEKPPAAEEEKQ